MTSLPSEPLFARLAGRPAVVGVASDPDGLRVYQREAVNAILEQLKAVRSTLLVAHVGAGKTQMFGCVAKHWDGRVLILAHRGELLDQAAARIRQMADLEVEVEKASSYAARSHRGGRVVVGSVQTMKGARLASWSPDAFSLIIIDEAHHAPSRSYTAVLDHFSGANVLGVTATPKRADNLAMGRVFRSVAYERGIHDGIADAFLVPVRFSEIFIDAIDLSHVKTTCGDLNEGELAAAMAAEEVLHGIARPLLEQAGSRSTIVFCTSVANAKRLAEILNRYRAGCAASVDQSTDEVTRRRLLDGHKRGEFQFMCNVGVLSEGYDSPGVSCIAMARPTKSEVFYVQTLGRGLRVLPGIGELATAEERRAAIASSAKADCLVLDFVGNTGRHELVSAVDILGGRYTDDERKAAKKTLKKHPGMLIEEALEKARAEIEKRRLEEAARRAKVTAKVEYRVATRDAFAAFSVLHMEPRPAQAHESAIRPDQADQLARRGVVIGTDVPATITAPQAEQLLRSLRVRGAKGLATYKQTRLLRKHGIDAVNMTFERASAEISALAANGWRRPPQPVSERQPGEEG